MFGFLFGCFLFNIGCEMIIECLVGNLRDLNFLDFSVDYVDLEWFEMRKKIVCFKIR